MKNLTQIFDKLNLSRKNGLFIADEPRKSIFSNRVERLLIEKIKPDAFYCIDNKPFILFFENLGTEKNKKLQEIWNFNESPIVIISEEDSVEIYNGFEYLFDEETLTLFGREEKLNDFSYIELVTGKTWEKYEKNFSSKNRIDYFLLNNIKAAREILISQSLSQELSNSLIGKIIFVRYLIDRGIKLNFEQKEASRKWSNAEFCDLLLDKNKVKSFFKYLKAKFNGDLFPITEKEIDSIPSQCFKVIVDLLSGSKIDSGQQSLFDLYDFSIIPVEFISNVYEVFIGENKQEKEGAYYTPLFLVDYILAETVEKQFHTHNNHNCKVLDPSCGSGIFLVETLRKIIEKYQTNNPDYLQNIEQYKKDLKQLASDNIFGIDKDKSAVNVAIFSIYLTLLDYQSPSDIENFKFPHLENKNFFASDFFDTKAEFNEVIQKQDFSFILGNPPWKRGKGEEKNPLFVKYIKERRKKEKGKLDYEIEISNSEIAQAFVLRTSDFSSANTNISLIVTSKLLYNLNGKNFRQYFLDQFSLQKVFELAPVRKEVFNSDGAVAPAAVLFYNYAQNKNTDKNIIKHITLKPSRFFSLFKVFTIQRGDYKEVAQEKLKKYDYLWKVLVYGSYLDFNLINRLKKDYNSVGKLCSNKEDFLIGQGAMIGGGDKNDASHLIGKPFIDTRKDIKSFWINENISNTWSHKAVHRVRNSDLYKAPMLLITEGINTKLRSVSTVCEKNIVFKSSLTAVKSFKNDVETLKTISGILNSSFFSYFCLQTFSSSGIEREQSHDKEKFEVPFINSNSIVSIVTSLTKLKTKELNSLLDSSFSNEINRKVRELDNTVLSSFSFSAQEKDLLNYATEITIPMIMKHKGYERIFKPLKLESEVISEYITLFFERFNPVYEKLNQKLVVEVKYTKQIIGLFFKLVSLNTTEVSIKRSEEKNTAILELLSSLGVEKITNSLFIQKDIRGFEENGFYIIKPNEKKLWHKATGHLDVNEFMDAILLAGKKTTFNV